MKHFSSLSLAIVVSLISLALATAAFYSGVFLAVLACFFVLLIAVADYFPKSSRPLRSPRSPQEMAASASSQALRLAA